MQPTQIDIRSATRTYPVFVAHGVVDQIARRLSTTGVGERRLLVSSPTVWKLHGETLTAALPGVEHVLVPDGERSKTLQTVARIYTSLIRLGADRQSTIIAVGGGVIGDTVGFAAATYLRGVDLVHVPTTLLAQVDSAVGGKVGVNHPLGKNLNRRVPPAGGGHRRPPGCWTPCRDASSAPVSTRWSSTGSSPAAPCSNGS